eukprot:PhM_4_TR3524/c0_g1_i1/m.16759
MLDSLASWYHPPRSVSPHSDDGNKSSRSDKNSSNVASTGNVTHLSQPAGSSVPGPQHSSGRSALATSTESMVSNCSSLSQSETTSHSNNRRPPSSGGSPLIVLNRPTQNRDTTFTAIEDLSTTNTSVHVMSALQSSTSPLQQSDNNVLSKVGSASASTLRHCTLLIANIFSFLYLCALLILQFVSDSSSAAALRYTWKATVVANLCFQALVATLSVFWWRGYTENERSAIVSPLWYRFSVAGMICYCLVDHAHDDYTCQRYESGMQLAVPCVLVILFNLHRRFIWLVVVSLIYLAALCVYGSDRFIGDGDIGWACDDDSGHSTNRFVFVVGSLVRAACVSVFSILTMLALRTILQRNTVHFVRTLQTVEETAKHVKRNELDAALDTLSRHHQTTLQIRGDYNARNKSTDANPQQGDISDHDSEDDGDRSACSETRQPDKSERIIRALRDVIHRVKIVGAYLPDRRCSGRRHTASGLVASISSSSDDEEDEEERRKSSAAVQSSLARSSSSTSWGWQRISTPTATSSVRSTRSFNTSAFALSVSSRPDMLSTPTPSNNTGLSNCRSFTGLLVPGGIPINPPSTNPSLAGDTVASAHPLLPNPHESTTAVKSSHFAVVVSLMCHSLPTPVITPTPHSMPTPPSASSQSNPKSSDTQQEADPALSNLQHALTALSSVVVMTTWNYGGEVHSYRNGRYLLVWLCDCDPVINQPIGVRRTVNDAVTAAYMAIRELHDSHFLHCSAGVSMGTVEHGDVGDPNLRVFIELCGGPVHRSMVLCDLAVRLHGCVFIDDPCREILPTTNVESSTMNCASNGFEWRRIASTFFARSAPSKIGIEEPDPVFEVYAYHMEGREPLSMEADAIAGICPESKLTEAVNMFFDEGFEVQGSKMLEQLFSRYVHDDVLHGLLLFTRTKELVDLPRHPPPPSRQTNASTSSLTSSSRTGGTHAEDGSTGFDVMGSEHNSHHSSNNHNVAEIEIELDPVEGNSSSSSKKTKLTQ